MGDAAGKPAYRLHFLRLPELLLQSAPLGYIFNKQFEGGFLIAVTNRATRNPERGIDPIFPLPIGYEAVEGRG
jgi:hypothetical protein